MQRYLAAFAIPLLLGTVCARILLMKRSGTKAMKFGEIDKKDFLIPPFALFYFYLVFAAAFHLPTVTRQQFFQSATASWVGALLCLAGVAMLVLSVVSFGNSFRVGIDPDQPDKLITTGVFAFTRNPIYVAFGLVLLGEFLVFPNWIFLAYVFAGIWLFHRQIMREEEFLRMRHGEVYEEYCDRVRRYL